MRARFRLVSFRAQPQTRDRGADGEGADELFGGYIPMQRTAMRLKRSVASPIRADCLVYCALAGIDDRSVSNTE